MTLLDDLLDARRGPLVEAFSEDLHPRTFLGQFAKKLGGLKSGESAHAPGGVSVRKVGREYHVTGGEPGTYQHPDPGLAADAAVTRSLRSSDPASLGGKSYLSMRDYERKHGKGRSQDLPTDTGKAPRATTRKRKLKEEELPQRVGKGKWSKGVDKTVKDLRSGRVVDTEHAHRETLEGGTLGAYSPERAALHERIATLLLRHANEHPGEARAIFLAGGPASGKSTLVSSGNVSLPGDAVDVNPDIVRTMLPEYHKLLAAGDSQAAAKTHEEASHVSKLVMNLALHRQHHVVVDGVGGGAPGKFAGKVRASEAAGHKAEVHVVTIPTEEAVRRAEKRASNPNSSSYGRNVPTGYLRSSHAEVSERFAEDVQHLPVRVHVYDSQGKTPVMIATKQAQEKLRVLDEKRYREFLAKSRAKAGQKK